MKRLQPFAAALILSVAAVTAQAAPSNWGNSDSSLMSSAEAHIDAKNYQAAIADLKKVVAQDRHDADAYNLLGYTHRKLKLYGQAEEYYLRALRLDSDHKGALEYLGELYVETDRMDKAREMLKRLDDACFLGCEEYTTLKDMIEQKLAGAEIAG